MFKTIVAGVVASVAMAGAAQAQDGTFGGTSSDVLTINATIDPVVRVSGLSSIDFEIGATFLNSVNRPNITLRPEYCIYSNVGTEGSYSLSVLGSTDPATGGDNSWALIGADNGGELHYTVSHTDGTKSGVMGPGDNVKFSAAGEGTRPVTADCDGGASNNSQLIVLITRATILAATADEYTGTLTVVASAT